MKALTYEKAHDLENFAIVLAEIEEPNLRKSDVLVSVQAIGINPGETSIRKIRSAEAGGRVLLGWEFAGVIIAIGSKVEKFQVGDRVFGAGDMRRDGAWAERLAIDHRIISKMPAKISFPEAASLPIGALTAWEALFRDQDVLPIGIEHVLVIGGAGGVGSIATQLLKATTEVRVIATANTQENFCTYRGRSAATNRRKSSRRANGADDEDRTRAFGIVTDDWQSSNQYTTGIKLMEKINGKVGEVAGGTSGVSLKKYLLTGTTGNLGGAILKQVLAQGVPAEDVAVMVRQPQKADKLKELGVTLIEGDYFNYDSLVNAFTNAEKLLLIGAPSLTGRAEQHENISRAIKDAGVKRVVYVGFIRPEHPRVKLREVTDVEIKSEKDLIASGTDYTILRNPLYSEALLAMTTKGEKDTEIRGGVQAGKTTTATTSDLAEAAANVLIQDGHKNKIYRLSAGENYSLEQVAKLLSDASGKSFKYIPTTKEDFVKARAAAGEPEAGSEYIWQFIDSIAKGDYEEHSEDLKILLGRKPENLKDTISKKFAHQCA